MTQFFIPPGRLWIKRRIAGGDACRPWKSSAFPQVGKADYPQFRGAAMTFSTDSERGPDQHFLGPIDPSRNSLFQACFVGFTAAKGPGCWRAGLR